MLFINICSQQKRSLACSGFEDVFWGGVGYVFTATDCYIICINNKYFICNIILIVEEHFLRIWFLYYKFTEDNSECATIV